MQLDHRCFKGKTFRPTPEVLLNEELQLFAIATPWGPAFQTKNLFDFLVQNYGSFSSDEEKTSVYPQLQSLSKEENTLRALLLSCNDWVFKEQNQNKAYSYGYEIVCGHFSDGKLIFLQIGQPYIYLDRPTNTYSAFRPYFRSVWSFFQKRESSPPTPFLSFGDLS